MAPVLTLALLAHGASISTVSLLLGAYSFTVIAAEFPSGVFADLCGRKKAFLLSAVFGLLSYCLLLVSKTLPSLFIAMIIHGLSRAFSSGSIDALAIDDAVANGGALAKVTGRLAILESAGLAAGALAGGFLSGLGGLYKGNLTANLAVYALLFLLTVCCVHEHPRIQAEKENAGFRQLGLHVKESLSFMAQKGMVRILFVFSFITGFALISIETYFPVLLCAAGRRACCVPMRLCGQRAGELPQHVAHRRRAAFGRSNGVRLGICKTVWQGGSEEGTGATRGESGGIF